MDQRTAAQHAASLAEKRAQGGDEWAEYEAFDDCLRELRERLKRRAQFQVYLKDAMLTLEAALYDAQHDFGKDAAGALADHNAEAYDRSLR